MEDECALFTTATFSAAAVLTLVTALVSGIATFVKALVGKQWLVAVSSSLSFSLAILFATRDHPAAMQGNESRCKKAEKKQRMRIRAQSGPVEGRPDSDDGNRGEKEGFGRELSDEELNERIESFITEFQRHLVLDGQRRQRCSTPYAHGHNFG